MEVKYPIINKQAVYQKKIVDYHDFTIREKTHNHEKSRRLEFFLSCDNRDETPFKIQELIYYLERIDRVGRVNYWKRDMDLGDQFWDYMRNNILKSDIILIVCSKNSAKSQGVQREVAIINTLKKKLIIPVFNDLRDVMDTLGTINYLGIRFDASHFEKFLIKLAYRLKKMSHKFITSYRVVDTRC